MQGSLPFAISLQFPPHPGELALCHLNAAVHRRDIFLQHVAAGIAAAQDQGRRTEYLIAVRVIRMEVAVDQVAYRLGSHGGNRREQGLPCLRCRVRVVNQDFIFQNYESRVAYGGTVRTDNPDVDAFRQVGYLAAFFQTGAAGGDHNSSEQKRYD